MKVGFSFTNLWPLKRDFETAGWETLSHSATWVALTTETNSGRLPCLMPSVIKRRYFNRAVLTLLPK